MSEDEVRALAELIGLNPAIQLLLSKGELDRLRSRTMFNERFAAAEQGPQWSDAIYVNHLIQQVVRIIGDRHDSRGG